MLGLWTAPIEPETPAEAKLIRRLVAWGFPVPATPHDVLDEQGRFVGRLDLAWPAERVGGEYDGSQWHTPRHAEHDELRHAAIEALGWRVERVDRIDLAAGHHELRHRLHAAFQAQRHHSGFPG